MPNPLLVPPKSIPSFWGIIKEVVVSSLPQFVAGFGFFLLFVLIGYIIKWSVCWRADKSSPRYMVVQLIGKSLRLLFVLLGVIVGLGTAGVSTASLVTSIGLVGFALAFAMKDIISNIIAGALIIFNSTLEIGEEITVNNNTGKLTAINLRYATLENDTATLLVPNGTLLTSITAIAKDCPKPTK
jgi:small conductance mechanosensitive channel